MSIATSGLKPNETAPLPLSIFLITRNEAARLPLSDIPEENAR